MRIWKRHVQEVDLDNVYVWQWPVRITHWTTALSLWILSLTGIYMGYPFLIASGQASEHFLMGTAKLVPRELVLSVASLSAGGSQAVVGDG
jgi:Ni,Fe-hydrogenase I cytochrome b subunit